MLHQNSNNHHVKSDIVTATISPKEDEAGRLSSRLAPLNLYSAIASIEIDNKSSIAPTSTVSQI